MINFEVKGANEEIEENCKDYDDGLIDILKVDFENYKLMRNLLDGPESKEKPIQEKKKAPHFPTDHSDMLAEREMLRKEVENLRETLYKTGQKPKSESEELRNQKEMKILCLKSPSKNLEAGFIKVDTKTGQFSVKDINDIQRYRKFQFDGIFSNFKLGLLDDFVKTRFLTIDGKDYFAYVSGQSETNKKEISFRFAFQFSKKLNKIIEDSFPEDKKRFRLKMINIMDTLNTKEIPIFGNPNWFSDLQEFISLLKSGGETKGEKLLGKPERKVLMNASYMMVELCEASVEDSESTLEGMSGRLRRLQYFCICTTQKSYVNPEECIRESLSLCEKINYGWCIRRLFEGFDRMKKVVCVCIDTLSSRIFNSVRYL